MTPKISLRSFPIYSGQALPLLGILALLVGLIIAPKPWQTAWQTPLNGTRPEVVDAMVAWCFFPAGLCSLLLLAGLFWTSSQTSYPQRSRSVDQGKRDKKSNDTPNLCWIFLGGILILGFFLRWPAMQQSLWWDEIWTLRHAVGIGSPAASLTMEEADVFHPVRWWDTLFFYESPTNHIFYSLLARGCSNLWMLWPRSPESPLFSEIPLRLPALFFGLGGIVLIARVGKSWGYPGAGLLAALLFAINPWVIRYSVDGRSYSLLVFCILLILICLPRALASNDQRHWFGYGLSQFLLVWTFPFGFLLPAWLALFLLIYVWRNQRQGKVGEGKLLWRSFWRCHLYLATFLLPLMAPLVPQTFFWDDVDGNTGKLAAGWFIPELWSLFTIGLSFAPDPYPVNAWYPSSSRTQFTIVDLDAARWIAYFFLAVIFPFLVWSGIRTLQRINTATLVTALAIFTFPLPIIFTALQFERILYPRFLIFSLPVVLLLIALGLSYWREKWRRIGGFSGILLVLLIFAATEAERSYFRQHPIAPLREISLAALAEQEKNPDRESLVVSFGTGSNLVRVYAPSIQPVNDFAGLQEIITLSRARGQDLYLIAGHVGLNQETFPEAFALFENPEQFTEVVILVGYDVHSEQRLYRLRTEDP